MLFKSILAVATAASGVLATFGNSTCIQDSCAQAVIASSFPELQGSADCQSYFGTVTVTAANMTLIQTSTQVLNSTFLQTSTQIANATFSSTSTHVEDATVTSTSISLFTVTTSQFASVTKTEVLTKYTTVTTSYTSTVTPAQYYKREIQKLEHLPLHEREKAAPSSNCITRTYTTTHVYTTVVLKPTSSAPTSSLPISSLPTSSLSTSSIQTCSDAPTYADACDSCERYTSACSCVGVTGKTTTTVPGKTITRTVPVTSTSVTTEIIPVTVTSTSTQIIPVTTTSIYTSTITETTTIMETSSLTSSYSTATTTTAVVSTTIAKTALVSPTCSSITSSVPYTLKYSGFQTLNPVNPANTVAGAPPISYTFPGSLNVCAAATQCVQRAYSSTSSVGPHYYTINLQFVDATQSWLCVTYYDGATAPYFNVDTPGVSQSYGWSAY